MLGLVGAHRVGKTTLATKYAEKHGWKFAQTSVSALLREIGFNPSEIPATFEERLTAQEKLIERMDQFYREAQGMSVITDRTPVDLLIYTAAEAVGDNIPEALQQRFERYWNRCMEVCNRHFACLVVVQPGIPVTHADGKGVINGPYIEHLNALARGICADERLKVPYFTIPRARTDLDARVTTLNLAVAKVLERLMYEASLKAPVEFH